MEVSRCGGGALGMNPLDLLEERFTLNLGALCLSNVLLLDTEDS